MWSKRLVCILILLIYILFGNNCFSQNIIRGKVENTKGESQQGISVLLGKSKETSDIIGYSISDKNGEFSIKYSSDRDSVCVFTRSLNFRDTILCLTNTSQFLHIHLSPQINKIKEVNVKGIPIVSANDTTTYYVSSFEKGNDETIGDVINNMPGFTVEANGIVKYNGAEIEKYYIEGLDLLGSKYPLANKNLSNKQVAKVQVLHNHQPVKMLRKKVGSENTSLNLKLKNKYTATYRARGGVGVPWLKHSLNFSPMLFTPKNQMIASVQSNNIGEELYTQHRPLIMSTGYIDNFTNTKKELLELTHISPSFLPNTKGYLDNNSNLISYNYLTKINEDKQFKTNVSFYDDFSKENVSALTTYYLNRDTVFLKEEKKSSFTSRSLLADLTLTNNGEESYFNNTVRIEKYWDEAEENVNIGQQKTYVNNPFFSIANEFDAYKMIGKQIVNVKMFFDYDHIPNRLFLYPGVYANLLNNNDEYSFLEQAFNEEKYRSIVNVSFMFMKRKWRFRTNITNEYKYSKINSSIELANEKLLADTLINDIGWNINTFELSEEITFKKGDVFELKLNLPLRSNVFNLAKATKAIKKPNNNVDFNPSVNLYYYFLKYFTTKVRIYQRTSFGDVDYVTPGYIIKDYLTLSSGANALTQSQSLGSFINLEFKNVVSGWLANCSYQYNNKRNDLVSNRISLGNGAFATQNIMRSNNSISHNLFGELTYYFTQWGSSLSINSNHTQKQSDVLINNELQEVNFENTQYGISAIINKWRFVNFKYQFSYSDYKQLLKKLKYKYINHSHSLSAYLYINKQHWLSLEYELFLMKNKASSFNTEFGNIIYGFSPQNSKFKFKVMYRNIFNNKDLDYYNIGDISFVKNHFNIRHAEIILKLAYKF